MPGEKAAEEIQEEFPAVKFICARDPGQRFFYK
jgi:hypothetical protein